MNEFPKRGQDPRNQKGIVSRLYRLFASYCCRYIKGDMFFVHIFVNLKGHTVVDNDVLFPSAIFVPIASIIVAGHHKE